MLPFKSNELLVVILPTPKNIFWEKPKRLVWAYNQETGLRVRQKKGLVSWQYLENFCGDAAKNGSVVCSCVFRSLNCQRARDQRKSPNLRYHLNCFLWSSKKDEAAPTSSIHTTPHQPFTHSSPSLLR